MMAIEPSHPVLREIVSARLLSEDSLRAFSTFVDDADYFRYWLHGDGVSDNVLLLSLYHPRFGDLWGNGGQASMERRFPGLLTSTEEDWNMSFRLDRTAIRAAGPGAAADVAQRLSLLRRHLLSAPIERAFNGILTNQPTAPCIIQYRLEDKMWVIPEGSDRVTIVYEVNYQDFNDTNLAHIFLNEFKDVKGHIKNSPTITYSQAAPALVASRRPGTPSAGFMTITFLKAQMTDVETQATWLSTFKQYLTYHIQSLKTYLRMGMRRKTEFLLTELRHAVPETAEPKSFKRLRGTKTMREETKIVYNF